MTRRVMVRWFARRLAPWCAGAASLALAAPAAAQDDWGGEEAADEEQKKSESEPSDDSDAAASENAEDSADDDAGKLSAPPDEAPAEDEPEPKSKDQDGKAVGLRYRGLFIPKAVLELFMEGGESVYVNSVGPEFAIRDGKKEYILSAWMAFYEMGPTAIKGSDDDEYAWEIVALDLKSIYLTADFLWHTRLANKLELSYGGGLGLGLLFGDFFRTQATLIPGAERGNPDSYFPCFAQSETDPYCDDINDHYPGYNEPSWFGGGAKPVFFPWFAGQVGLRYQPHEKVVTRLDLGVSLSGVFFGVGADYSL